MPASNRYQKAALRFLRLTTPVYIIFMAVLLLIRSMGFDDFSNTVLLISCLHVFGLQISYFVYLKVQSQVSKTFMTNLLWFMVFNNSVLFCYWLVFLDQTRPYIYILAPMSTVSLFSVANFKQSAYLGSFQCMVFLLCSYLGEWRLGDFTWKSLQLDWLYIGVFWVVSIWLATVSHAHSVLKTQRDKITREFQQVANAALNSSVVGETATVLSGQSKRLHEISSEQKRAIDMLSVASEELQRTSEENAQFAGATLEAVKQTEQAIVSSSDDMNNLFQAMESLRGSGKEIASINQLINDIAYQTNVLSLNAMIEASQAKEQGSGFKVVALEVKKLAERSAKAAGDVTLRLQANTQLIEQSLGLSETMQQRFSQVLDGVKPLAQALRNVSDSSYEQSYAIKQMTDGLLEIERAAKESELMAVSASNTAGELQNNAQSLAALVESLKTL